MFHYNKDKQGETGDPSTGSVLGLTAVEQITSNWKTATKLRLILQVSATCMITLWAHANSCHSYRL